MTNQLLPEIRCCQSYLGVATLISNFTEYGLDTLALQLFWYPDTADSAETYLNINL
jgi:hypothetical protein